MNIVHTDWENLIERNPELKVNPKFMNVRFYKQSCLRLHHIILGSINSVSFI